MSSPENIPCVALWRRVVRFVILFVCLPLAAAGTSVAWLSRPTPPMSPFAALFDLEISVAQDGLRRIEAEWRPESVSMLLEVGHYSRHPNHGEQLERLLQKQTGQSFRLDPERLNNDWYRWLWKQPPLDGNRLNSMRHEFYRAHQSAYVQQLGEYFAGQPTLLIRAEELRWGGVFRDMIPPIRQPIMIPAAEAEYLADGDIVYGVVINGQARAYPRRILGHHEMVIDTVGDVTITGVYCPLCQVMIPYDSRTDDGTVHTMGTSGFLYRSNKLMYDKATKSLWQTMTGEPVVGPLAGRGLQLRPLPVVTTTWGEWRLTHPQTVTIALRGLPVIKSTDLDDSTDYSEGAAYRAYFLSDEISYHVPRTDPRLPMKAEVFVPVHPQLPRPLAFSAEFLAAHPIHSLKAGPVRMTIFTTPGGANRAYQTDDRKFRAGTEDHRAIDQDGTEWILTETGMQAELHAPLPRVAGFRTFWFAWFAAHPETDLVVTPGR